MPNVNDPGALTGADYSGEDISDPNTDSGWEAALRAKVAGKQSNDSTTTSVPSVEEGERFDPGLDSVAQIKQDVLADVPTLNPADALEYGRPAPKAPQPVEQELPLEKLPTMKPDELSEWNVEVDAQTYKAQQAQASEDRATVLYREFRDAYESEPLSNTEQFRALLEEDADMAPPDVRAAANFLLGAPEAFAQMIEDWKDAEIDAYHEQWGDEFDEVYDEENSTPALIEQAARELIAKERTQVEALRNEENRTRAQTTAYQGSKAAAKAWAREQGIRSSAEADQRIAAADNFLQSELGVSLEALAFQHPGVFKDQLTFADAALRGLESEDRVQRFKGSIMDADTTNVSEGLESSADRLERLLKRIAPDPTEPSREIDKAMARAELRANGESQTGASIKAQIMGADSETAVKHGFTRGGRKVSQEEAMFDPEREAELRRERIRAAGIR
jgi:hypothetical protein